jgi:hypothetical protein
MHEINYIVCKRYFKYALKFLKGDINPLIHKTVRHYNIAVIGLGYVGLPLALVVSRFFRTFVSQTPPVSQ